MSSSYVPRYATVSLVRDCWNITSAEASDAVITEFLQMGDALIDVLTGAHLFNPPGWSSTDIRFPMVQLWSASQASFQIMVRLPKQDPKRIDAVKFIIDHCKQALGRYIPVGLQGGSSGVTGG